MSELEDKMRGMSSSAHEVMWQLFKNGPTWDGDIVSKSGRGELFKASLASRVEGWSYLTAEGMELAVRVFLMGDRKERWDREQRRGGP
jgi:hypothetical protein